MRCSQTAVFRLRLLGIAVAVLSVCFAPQWSAVASLPNPDALQRASALAQSGQSVDLPAGVCAITEPIRLRSGARLIGAGQDKTVIHYASSKPGVMVSLQGCENVEVGQLTLDAENNPKVQQGIAAGNARRLRLHHLTIRNLAQGGGFGPHGILFAGVNPTRAHGVTDSDSGIGFHYFYRCRFNHTSSHRGKPSYPRDAGHGFRTNGNVHDCVFEDCEFSENDGYGLQFGGSGLDAFSFLRCAVRANKGPAMVGLRDYRALEWIDCTTSGNATDELPPQKPFGQPAPVANFKALAKARAGEAIRFASNSRSAAGRVAAALWDFNDGSPVSEVNPTHIYARPGHYRVTLVVWDESGRAGRVEQPLEVTSMSMPMPDGASSHSQQN